MFSLKEKNVLLTGASGGIGASIAETLIAAGAKVILSSPDRQRLELMADERHL